MGDSSTIYVIIQHEPRSVGQPSVRAVCGNLRSAEDYIRAALRKQPELHLELDVSELRH